MASLRFKCFTFSLASSLFVYWQMKNAFTYGISCTGAALLLLSLASSIISFDMYRLEPANSLTIQTLIYQYLFYRIMLVLSGIALKRFDQCCHDVIASQYDVLARILKRNSKTRYSRDHGLIKTLSVDRFRSVHPVTEYSHYAKYADAAARGEPDVLTPGRAYYVALTSGTTGRSKKIPRSNAFKQSFRNILDTIAPFWIPLFGVPGNAKLKKWVSVYTYAVVSKTEGGIRTGPASGSHNKMYLPFWTTPRIGLKISEETDAIYIHLLFALKEREVTTLSGMFSLSLLQFFRMMEEFSEQLCSDIETGMISESVKIPAFIRDELLETFTPDVDRARELRRHFANGFQGIGKRIWPDLSVVFTVATGSFRTPTEVMQRRYLGGVPVYCGLHGASEGFYGFQRHVEPWKGDISYVLLPTVSFCELLPIKYECQRNEALLPQEAKVGQQYEVVVTTYDGLYRYNTHDVIKVVDFFGKMPVYHFVQRSGDMVNIVNEKTPVCVIDTALTQTFSEAHARVVDYTCTESIHIEKAKGRYIGELFYAILLELESEEKISEQQIEQIEELVQLNQEDYACVREHNGLLPLRIIHVKTGTFQKLKELNVKRNTNLCVQQYKTGRVNRNAEYLTFLLSQEIES